MEKQTDMQAVDAALKRHGAISTEVTAGVRFKLLTLEFHCDS